MSSGAKPRPSILFIVPADYHSLREKGVEAMILDRDERGYFDKVVTLHPFCTKTQVIRLGANHEVHEIGLEGIRSADRRWSRFFQLPLHFCRILWTAVRLVRQRQLHVVRANDPYWTGLLAYLTARLCRVPYCVSIHADYRKCSELDPSISMSQVLGSHKLGELLARFVLSRADLVMPIRKSLAVWAAASGAKPRRIRVIPHGVDLSLFSAVPVGDIRKRFGIDVSAPIVSVVARMSKENYIDDVLEIARGLSQKRSDFVFVIAGGGKEERRVRTELAQDPVLRSRVLAVGFQPRQVCIELRRQSAVSLCLMGGFSLIEACAAACPVVSYDVDWHHELIRSMETGFLIRERDTRGAVDALEWLLAHPAERASMGARARALAIERHELGRTSAIKVRSYSEILAGTGLH